MEFIDEGKDPRLDDIYRRFEVLFPDMPAPDDRISTTQERQLNADELRIARVIFKNHNLAPEMQTAQDISLFRQVEEEGTDEGFIVSVDDGQLVTLYGFSRSENGYTTDKAHQVSKERLLQDDYEASVQDSLAEFSFIPTPEAWAATIAEGQRADGSFNDPDLELGINLEDLAIAIVQEHEVSADAETNSQELDAFVDLLKALEQYNRYEQAS